MAQASKVTFAFFLGAAAGAALAILYAPEKGEVTRARIRKEADQFREQAGERLRTVSEQLKATAETQKKILGERLEAGLSQASYKAEDVILALERRLAELRAMNQRYQAGRQKPLSE